jgi:AcrR family transcriptional regulator
MDLDSTKARIIEAAGVVFAEKGYEAATVRDICKRAGANLAAINYHFGDKHALYIEAVKSAHRARVEQLPLPKWAPDTRAIDRLRSFIRTLLGRMLSNSGSAWRNELMLREMMSPNSACEALVKDFIRPDFESLLGVLSELLPTDTPEEKRHLVAFSIVGQCLHYRIALPVVRLLISPEEYGTYGLDKLAEHILSFTLHGLEVGSRQQLAGGLSCAGSR